MKTTALHQLNNNQPKTFFWLSHMDLKVLKRASVIALLIGGALTITNQNAAVFGHASFVKLQLILAFITPFIVITFSQLGAIHQAESDKRHRNGNRLQESFGSSLLRHKIPSRAFLISLVVGSSSTAIILTNTFLITGEITNAPLSQILQTYVLPFVFGALSQALTYRRQFL